tara:strand:- start:44 stop:484 length:441 start_codon:yes stop_codon:yes gene_type:complete
MSSSIAAALSGASQNNNTQAGISPSIAQAIQQITGSSQAQMQASATAADVAGAAGAAGVSDPNNMSATGIGSSNIVQSNMMPATPGMAQDLVGQPPAISSAVGGLAAPITTGGFTPQNQTAAEGIFGDQGARQASFQKPLTNIYKR